MNNFPGPALPPQAQDLVLSDGVLCPGWGSWGSHSVDGSPWTVGSDLGPHLPSPGRVAEGPILMNA